MVQFISSFIPYLNANGFPVSLHVGNGPYMIFSFHQICVHHYRCFFGCIKGYFLALVYGTISLGISCFELTGYQPVAWVSDNDARNITADNFILND